MSVICKARTGKLLIALSIAMLGHSAQAACIDPKAAAEIRSSVEFKGIDTGDAALCDPTTQAYKIFDALATMKQSKFPSPRSTSAVDQNFFKTDFWSYFTSRIKSVENESGDTCQGRLAFAVTALQLHTIFVCPDFYTDHTSRVERMAVLLHEPRHDEADGFSHVQCTQPYTLLAGQACDESFATGGAWAVTIEALHLLLKNPLLTATDTNLIKYKMLEIGSVYLNQPIFSLAQNSAVYLIGKDGQSAFVYSDRGLRKAPLITAGKPISRRFSIIVFPTDKSDSFTAGLFTKKLQLLPALGASSVAYNASDKADRDPVVDILNDDDQMLAVTAHKLDILGAPEMTVPFEISGILSSLEAGEKASQNFYLKDTQGKFHKVLKGRGGDVKIQDSANPIEGYSQVVTFEGKRLGLLDSGKVMVNSGSGWSEFTPLAGRQFQFISRPFLWSETLNSAN